MYIGCIQQVHQHQTLKLKLSNIRNKVPKEKKGAFIHSSTVLSNKSFKSETEFAHSSKVLAFLSCQMTHSSLLIPLTQANGFSLIFFPNTQFYFFFFPTLFFSTCSSHLFLLFFPSYLFLFILFFQPIQLIFFLFLFFLVFFSLSLTPHRLLLIPQTALLSFFLG